MWCLCFDEFSMYERKQLTNQHATKCKKVGLSCAFWAGNGLRVAYCLDILLVKDWLFDQGGFKLEVQQ